MKALFRFDVICDESKIQKTIAVSKEAFPVSYTHLTLPTN